MRLSPFFIVFALWFSACLSLPASAFADPLSERSSHGLIDWENGYVEATGQGTAGYLGNRVQEELMAKEAARMSAQARLLAQIEGVRLTGLSTLGESAHNNTRAATRIKGTLRGAVVLSEAVTWHPDETTRRKEVPLANVTLRVCLLPSCTETPFNASTAALELNNVPSSVPEQESAHSALILDLQQALYLPTLAPEIVTRSGHVLYSHELVDAQAARSKGLIHYTKTVSEARTLSLSGDSPLVLEVLEIDQNNKIIIADAHAKELANAEFLTQGRVVIALD